jgi:hypothetical protein
MTTCCERVGVIDDELQDFYWNADTPSQLVSLLDDAGCPFCGASPWARHRIEDVSQVPELWRWACKDRPRPGSRRIRPLAEHVEELLQFCRRVAGPIPPFNTKLFLNTSDPRARFDGRWVVERGGLQTASEFAPRFNELLMAGYACVSLSAHGVFGDALIVGVELPREATGVPVGLTSVNYAGPAQSSSGTPNWEFCLCIVDQDGVD